MADFCKAPSATQVVDSQSEAKHGGGRQPILLEQLLPPVFKHGQHEEHEEEGELIFELVSEGFELVEDDEVVEVGCTGDGTQLARVGEGALCLAPGWLWAPCGFPGGCAGSQRGLGNPRGSPGGSSGLHEHCVFLIVVGELLMVSIGGVL